MGFNVWGLGFRVPWVILRSMSLHTASQRLLRSVSARGLHQGVGRCFAEPGVAGGVVSLL